MASVVEVRGLGKQQIGQLAAGAKRLGITRDRYAKQLLEERLEIEREAQSQSFAELTGTGRSVNEEELDTLVSRVREFHHQKSSKRKR